MVAALTAVNWPWSLNVMTGTDVALPIGPAPEIVEPILSVTSDVSAPPPVRPVPAMTCREDGTMPLIVVADSALNTSVAPET